MFNRRPPLCFAPGGTLHAACIPLAATGNHNGLGNPNGQGNRRPPLTHVHQPLVVVVVVRALGRVHGQQQVVGAQPASAEGGPGPKAASGCCCDSATQPPHSNAMPMTSGNLIEARPSHTNSHMNFACCRHGH